MAVLHSISISRVTAHAHAWRVDHRQKHVLAALVLFCAVLADKAGALIDALAANGNGRFAAAFAFDIRRIVSGHDPQRISKNLINGKVYILLIP
jgi:hypothetical protein